jgi:hypothetical protein
MDQDNDVEHLFSWLQTPELRYREFAGAREITDKVVTWRARANTPLSEAERPVPPHGDVQLREEYPSDQFPDQAAARVEIAPAPSSAVHDPRTIAPPASRPTADASLLGGAYREDAATGQGAEPSGPAEQTVPQQRGDRSLDAVFGRLAGRDRLPDPRDRGRYSPGLGPPSGRPR